MKTIKNLLLGLTVAAMMPAAAEAQNCADFFNSRTPAPTYRYNQASKSATCYSGSKYKFVPAEGSWFQLVDFSDISKESDRDFCLRLAKEFGVAAYPMSAYYHDKTKTSVIRICFARQDETIREGVKRMLNYK